MVFGGINIWIANTFDDSLIKLSPGGKGPSALAFDGEHIWVTDFIGNSVSKLDQNGLVLDTVVVGQAQEAVVSDCASIWVTNSESGDITRIRMNDSAHLGTYQARDRPLAIAFDGQYIWVADFNQDTVTRISWFPVPVDPK